MTTYSRPNLEGLSPEIIDYIELLERELERFKSVESSRSRRISRKEEPEEDLEDPGEVQEPTEPPTSLNVITITGNGICKRTPRHHYNIQRRGGMGIFDLDSGDQDPPVSLAIAEPDQTILLITNLGRAFRLAVQSIPETPVRGRGLSMISRLSFETGERVAKIVDIQAQGYLALLGQNGMTRLLRHHVFGEYMKPGANLFDLRTFGRFADACWTPGDSDLLVATRDGKAIRFAEKAIAPQGSPGIRLSGQDQAVAVVSVSPDSGVFFLGSDGKGTIRTMQGFSANKAPGSGGKIAMIADRLVGAIAIEQDDQVFIISKLSKIIRFRSEEIPQKDGVVQGVVCMSLRADEPVALYRNPLNK